MREDYRRLPDGDLDLSGGDLVITESTEKHQIDLILSDKGHIRNMPEIGVGAANYLNENDHSGYLRAVRMAFASDGMKVRKVTLDRKGNTIIEAEYENS